MSKVGLALGGVVGRSGDLRVSRSADLAVTGGSAEWLMTEQP
jgi:hypothetical protein